MKLRKSKLFIIGGAIAFILIIVSFFIFSHLSKSVYICSNGSKVYAPGNCLNNQSSNIPKIYGMNDTLRLESTSFRLVDVQLQKWKETTMFTTEVDGNVMSKNYLMLWIFEVTNNGEKIEYVSNCGNLLFEDESQYDFNIGKKGCGDYEIIPGAKIRILSTFFFSDDYLWGGSAKPWGRVAGQNITYFSQQTNGLIKYVINKNELNYSEVDLLSK